MVQLVQQFCASMQGGRQEMLMQVQRHRGMQGTKHSADEQEDVYQKRRQGDGTIYETNLLGL